MSALHTNHLRGVWQLGLVPGDDRPVGRAVAVGELAGGSVAQGGPEINSNFIFSIFIHF